MKITISRIFETSKLVSELAKVGIGQSASDFTEYISSFVELVLRGLRNGLNFTDNFDCLVKTVSVTSGSPQVVETNSSRQPTGCFAIRALSTSSISGFNWYMDANGRFNVIVNLNPVPTDKVDVTIVILF